MPAAYPRALRERVLAAIDRGMSQAEAAEVFDLARATIVMWLRRRRETGDVEPKPRGGGNRSHVKVEVLEACLQELPDGTRDELLKLYNKRVPRKERSSASGIYRALVRHGYVFKKSDPAPQSRTVRT